MLVEPDAEIVQSYPRRQASPQPLKLVGPLSPQTEGVEELVVDRLHDLADAGDPSPQALGPYLTGVAFGRTDKPRSVPIEPAPMVFFALEALVGDVGPPGRRAHTG